MSYIIILAVLIIFPGCGTFSNGSKQTIFVQAIAGNKVVDANCKFSNLAGSWQATSSSDIVIKKSAGDLTVECLSEDQKFAGKKIVSSEMNSSMWASIVTVGVGAVVDAATASGFDYPRNMIVLMNKVTQRGIQ